MSDSYQFKTPLSVIATSTLSHDVIMTDNILVDSQSITPVAMITNLASKGIPGNTQIEALAIVTLAGENNTAPQLCHVARTPNNESGWQITSIFTDIQPVEVAAGTNKADTTFSTVYAFFTDSNNLYYTTLNSDGATWASYSALNLNLSTYNGMYGLQVTYTPLGTMVLYGKTSTGDLITVYPQVSTSAQPTVNICSLKGALLSGSFRLCMNDESSWYLTVTTTSEPILYIGTLSGQVPESQESIGTVSGTLNEVALCYWSHASGQQSSAIWMFLNAENQLQIWSMGGHFGNNGQVIPTVGDILMTEATGYVATDGTVHIYYIDNSSDMGLWVLHQYPGGWDQNGIPQFAPPIPLGTGISSLVCDTNPRENASFFALDGGDYSLRLHTQDVNSQLWKSFKITTPATEMYELVRFRTELGLIDANGVPVKNYPITLNVTSGYSACDIAVSGSNLSIGNSPVELTTDLYGRLTFSILADNGISAPNMELNAFGMNMFPIMPAASIQQYLSGALSNYNPTNPNGPLPIFDNQGTTLQQAIAPDGTPLYANNSVPAGIAATAISNGALVGLNSTPINGDQYNNVCMSKPAKFFITDDDSLWDKIKHFFGDIWEGIKSKAIMISNVVVDIANKIASFTIKIRNEIINFAKIAINGLEEAGHFIVGVFNWIGAQADKVIDWLKAIFDFKAIMRTASVFETGLISLPNNIKQLVQTWDFDLSTWFTKQKQLANNVFEQIEANYANKLFGSFQNFHSPGNNGTNPSISGVATNDFTHNVHHHWLEDKVNAGAGNTSPVKPSDSIRTPWDSFKASLEQSDSHFIIALGEFKNAVISTIKDPSSFATIAIPDFLKMLNNMTDVLLELCNAIVDGLFALTDVLMDALDAILSTSVGAPPLQALWRYISGSQEPLTVASLMSLLAAFPATIIYKLMMGSNNEPFPVGSNPFSSSAINNKSSFSQIGPTIKIPAECVIIAGILQVLQVIPAGIGDFYGNNSPWPVSFVTTINSALIFLLTNGNAIIYYAALDLVIVAAIVALLVLDTGKVSIPQLSNDDKDKIDLLVSVYGLFKLGLGLYEGIKQEDNELQQTEGFLLPIPYIFTFLNMGEFRNEPEIKPFAIAANLTFDVIGYIGAGACQINDGINHLKN